MAKQTTNEFKPFRIRFPFRLREAMAWVANVHRWLLSQNLNLGMDRLLIPTEIEEKTRGTFRVFFSGGVTVWIHMDAHAGNFGEQWSVEKVRVTYPTGDGTPKAQKIWEGHGIGELAFPVNKD